MEVYVTLPEIEENEKKYGHYSEQDKDLLCEKINTFQNLFFDTVQTLCQNNESYAKDFRHCTYFIDILPTTDKDIIDFLKKYIGYDFLLDDFHILNTSEAYRKMLNVNAKYADKIDFASYAKPIQELFEELFDNEYLEICHVGNKKYVMPDTNIFYVLLDVYCIRYKNYTLVISYGNDE